jgi:hypothetical protein
MTATDAVSYFEVDLRVGLLPFTADDVRAELAGHDLCCWCPLDQRCHADVLLQVANPDWNLPADVEEFQP